MRQRFNRLLGAIVLSILLASTLHAQSKSDVIRKVVEEKMHITPEQLREAILHGQRPPVPDNDELEKRSSVPLGNIAVSKISDPESEVHAAINPVDSNNIVVSPIRTSTASGSSLTCPIYYTWDFGVTWKKSAFAVPGNPPGSLMLGGGDPMFAFDADGTLYFSWISLFTTASFDSTHFSMYWASSTDGGATWTKPANNLIGEGLGSGFSPSEVFDKQWLVVDRSTSQFRNNLYAAFMEANQEDGIQRIGVRRKEATGQIFTQTSVFLTDTNFKGVQFTSIDVDSHGGVHVSFFGLKAYEEELAQWALWHSVSTDGGKTFSDPTKISNLSFPGQFATDGNTTETIPGINAGRIYPCPHLVVDPSALGHDNLYMVWTANGIQERSTSGLDIYFSRSTDNGSTWSTPTIVNDDLPGLERHQFYPSIAVSPTGTIAVTWYDQRDDADHLTTKYFMAYSTDQGQTFGKNFPVSTAATDFGTIGEQNGGFGIGEYTQVMTTNGYAIPVWSDGRSENGNLDIYAAFIPLVNDPDNSSSVRRIERVTAAVRLLDPVPNPVAAADASVVLQLDRADQVKLTVVDLKGTKVATVVDRRLEPGDYRFAIPTKGLAAGNYYLRLESADGPATRPLTVVR